MKEILNFKSGISKFRSFFKNRKKEPLYVFLHVPKCAGSTIRTHIVKNFKKNQFVFAYSYSKRKQNKWPIEDYIKFLTQKEKDNLKIIIGHKLCYGIHDLFKNREVRYITFVREPCESFISKYNYFKGVINDIHPARKEVVKSLKKELTKNNKEVSFEDWYLSHILTMKRVTIASIGVFFNIPRNRIKKQLKTIIKKWTLSFL